MIRVYFDPNMLSGQEKVVFDNWLKLAERVQLHHNAEIAAGNNPKFRSGVWSALKLWLLQHVFHSKCAYCELNIEAGFVGDAEHYRPKSAVHEDAAHNGYYWVAYDWKNLIPSCQKCNAGDGKMTKFPIQGMRALVPADARTFEALNALEQPLLLHPYDLIRDPADHLVFTPDGAVVGVDLIGKTTIEVLNLDREGLKEQRRARISDVRGKFSIELGHVVANGQPGTLSEKIDQILATLTQPNVVFSAAIRDVLQLIRLEIAPLR